MRRRHRDALTHGWPWGALVVILVFACWMRLPGFVQGGFANHDVGGILYGSMLLHAGKLPYVDSFETKSPGALYLATILAGPEGRDIATFQIAANAWALFGLLAVAGLGLRIFDKRAAVTAAAIYVLHDSFLDSMDANYVTWAQLPQILAFWAAYEATCGRTRTLAHWAWFLAGVCTGGAALLKQPAGAIAIVTLAWATVSGTSTSGRRFDPRPLLLVLAGVAAIHVPVFAHYAAAGQVMALLRGYVFNSWAARYVFGGPQPVAGEGVLAAAFFLAPALASAAFAAIPGRKAAAASVVPWLWLWAVTMLGAAAIGLRFYKGYFLAVAPPLAILGAAPWGLWGADCRARTVGRLFAMLALGLLVVRQGVLLRHTRSDRFRPHDLGARKIARHIERHTSPTDTIWVWGWHLWDVYALSGRLSASRVYKSLGLLTPPNDDTWRRPASRLVFVDGEFADIVLEDLRHNRPAFVVLGSTVPRHDFVALRSFLRQGYMLDQRVRVGRAQIWRRLDLADGAR